jgi:hypothetical protein
MSIEQSIIRLTTREIPLKGGSTAIVDIEDYKWARLFKWTHYSSGDSHYARTSSPALRKTVAMHRVIAGAEPGQIVDHRNGNGLDNRKSNLRIATYSQNARNKRAQSNSSRYKGVVFDEGRNNWIARVRRDGRYVVVGRFELEEEAAAAYNHAALQEYGEFAWINPLGDETTTRPPRRGRPPKPWFWKSRGGWYSTIEGKRQLLARGEGSEEIAQIVLARAMEAIGQVNAVRDGQRKP